MNASTSSSSFTTLSYSLQINKISAESLTMARKKPVGKKLFVTISTKENDNIDHYQAHSYRNQPLISSKLCEQGYGTLVAWDEKFEMDVPMHVKFIVLDVCYATRSGNKSIGIANVPISDFVGGLLPRDYLHCLSYRLRDRDGNPNGIINFSVKVVNCKGFDYLKRGYESSNNDNNMHYCNDNNGLYVEKWGYGVSKGKIWQENTSLVYDYSVKDDFARPQSLIDGYWRRNGGGHAVVGVPVAWYNK